MTEHDRNAAAYLAQQNGRAAFVEERQIALKPVYPGDRDIDPGRHLALYRDAFVLTKAERRIHPLDAEARLGARRAGQEHTNNHANNRSHHPLQSGFSTTRSQCVKTGKLTKGYS